MVVVKSDLKNVNDIIEGYDQEVPLAVYGIAKTGKTLFCIQEAFYLMKLLNKNALFVSTEVGVKRYIEKLEPIFRKRYAVPEKLGIVLVECPPQNAHLEKIAKLFGKTIKLKMGDTGKVDPQFLGSTKEGESEIEKEIAKHNIGVLIVDSLTKPFKSEEFAGVLKNLPSRATAVNIWLNAIHSIALKNRLYTFVTHHASLDPTNPYATPLMTGGGDINYDFKIQVYMQQSLSRAYSSMRWVYLVRFFNEKEWSKKTRLWVTDDGYVDVDDAFMEKMKAKSDKEREEKKEEAKKKDDK